MIQAGLRPSDRATSRTVVLYNEIERYPAQWLRNLVAAGHIAAGTVDERSIKDLQPEDVRGQTQTHFFAGIGVWSAGLRLGGWPDDCPIWTGSCPCQPFSTAGLGGGIADDRHLWPEWYRLIRECAPPVIVGEQVASPAGLGWLDAVFVDLEGAGYACAAVDFGAASVGAPHQRQRLYFVAIADCKRLEGIRVQLREWRSRSAMSQAGRRGAPLGLADHSGTGSEGSAQRARGRTGVVEHDASARREGRQDGGSDSGDALSGSRRDEPVRTGGAGFVEYPGLTRGRGNPGSVSGAQAQGDPQGRFARRVVDISLSPGAAHATRGYWSPTEWLACRDGKARPAEPGTFPLAHGATSRVGRLRAYGNAIVRPQAAIFTQAVIDLLIGACG